ncbi:MAG: EamA family transporter [Spirochaetia bacterium]|nr:EamA family transporter [Spirochaetia bacterium]
MFLFFAIVSALFYGLGDFSGGYAASKSRILSVLVVSQVFGLATAAIALTTMGPGLPGGADLIWGLVGGLAGALGIVTLYRGIATGVVAIVSPTAALLSSILPLGVGLLLGDRPGILAIVGIVLCVPAVLLLSSGPADTGADKARVRSSLYHGIVAGLGFGLFYVALSRPGVNSGFWPLVAARTASIAVALFILLARREPLVLNKGSRMPAVLAGILDMVANIFFVLASSAGMLSIVAIVVSLYPAPTVLMARVVFKERITPVRWVGLGLSLAGLALISLG